jgi:hypothetical protein
MENLNYVCTITEPRLLKTGVDQDTIHFAITTVLEDFFFHNKNQETINKKIAKTKGPLAELVFLAGLSYPPQVELYIYIT